MSFFTLWLFVSVKRYKDLQPLLHEIIKSLATLGIIYIGSEGGKMMTYELTFEAPSYELYITAKNTIDGLITDYHEWTSTFS
jgi:hypothetical protein